MCRLCIGGSSEIGPKGRVSDDRERSKCSMITGGVWGNMDIYFWGLLGVDVEMSMIGRGKGYNTAQVGKTLKA
jgi:hypothetical protein